MRFKCPVTPGDSLVMEMTLVKYDAELGFATMTGNAYVGSKLAVSVAEFNFALTNTN